MIPITHELSLKMSGTNRLICQEMLGRGWRLEMPYWYTSHFYIDRCDGQTIHIFSSSPPTLSFAAAHVSNDKYATSNVISAHGILQLPMYLVDDAVTAEARQFMEDNAPIIVKPLDGSHGKGITTGVASEGQLSQATQKARESSYSGKVLLQKQLTGVDLKDVRVLIIGGQYIGAIHRTPARVFGDGRATVEELITRENQQLHRGEPYKNKLAVIDLEPAQTFLGEAMEHIPRDGEEVTVLGVANYGAGGELVDVSDVVPEWMKNEAVRIAEALELKVAGVDYMVSGAVADARRDGVDAAVVIEVNKSPSLAIHDEPTVGKSREAVKAYVDYLATL